MPSTEYSFDERDAERRPQPLRVILIGQRKAGKTFTAERIARGIQSVTKQRIVMADSEAPRGEAYADVFDHRYVNLAYTEGEPRVYHEYPPERHIALLRAFPGAILINDSWSDWHDGPGGVLDIHARMVRADRSDAKPGSKGASAWRWLKVERTNLVRNAIRSYPGTIVMCVRAKPPSPPGGLGKKVWTAIMDDRDLGKGDLIFYLENEGRPVWSRADIQTGLTSVPNGIPRACIPEQLDESVGAMLANWSRGVNPTHPVAARLAEVSTADERRAVWDSIKKEWGSLDQYSKRQIEIAGKAARDRIAAQTVDDVQPQGGE